MNLVLWCFRGYPTVDRWPPIPPILESVARVQDGQYAWSVAYAGELSMIDGIGLLEMLRYAIAPPRASWPPSH